MSDLPTPPEGAIELLRAWFVGETLECSVRPGVFENPGMWGALLADLTRYIAMGLQQEEGRPVGDTIRQIREAFDQELTGPVENPP